MLQQCKEHYLNAMFARVLQRDLVLVTHSLGASLHADDKLRGALHLNHLPFLPSIVWISQPYTGAHRVEGRRRRFTFTHWQA
jgi:hypothetical protein